MTWNINRLRGFQLNLFSPWNRYNSKGISLEILKYDTKGMIISYYTSCFLARSSRSQGWYGIVPYGTVPFTKEEGEQRGERKNPIFAHLTSKKIT